MGLALAAVLSVCHGSRVNVPGVQRHAIAVDPSIRAVDKSAAKQTDLAAGVHRHQGVAPGFVDRRALQACDDYRYNLTLTDSWGDGWGLDYAYTVTNLAGNELYSGALTENVTEQHLLCLAQGYYTISVDGGPGGFPSEIGWQLCDSLAANGTNTSVPFAIDDDGTCSERFCQTLLLQDSYGDGWDTGYTFGVYDYADSSTAIFTGALSVNVSESVSLCLPKGYYTVGLGSSGVVGGYPSEMSFTMCDSLTANGTNSSVPFAIDDEGTCSERFCLDLVLVDLWGDGWDAGYSYTVADASGDEWYTGTLAANVTETHSVCVPEGTIDVVVGGGLGGFPSEMQWSLCGYTSNGTNTSDTFSIASDGTCTYSGTQTPTTSPTPAPTGSPTMSLAPTLAPTDCRRLLYTCSDGTVMEMTCAGGFNATTAAELRCLVEEFSAETSGTVSIAINGSLSLTSAIAVPASATVKLAGAAPVSARRRLDDAAGASSTDIDGLTSSIYGSGLDPLFSLSARAKLELSSLILSNGSSSSSGGLITSNGGSVSVDTCLLTDGFAETNGGAIAVVVPFSSAYSVAVDVVNSVFRTNVAKYYGGAIAVSSYSFYGAEATVTVTGSTFDGNTADDVGGALYVDNYFPTTSDLELAVTETDVSGNRAFGGAGIFASMLASVHVAHSHFSHNNASEVDASHNSGYSMSGGGLYVSQTTGTVTNVTGDGNTAHAFGGFLYADDSSRLDVFTSTVTNSLAMYGGAFALYGGALVELYYSDLRHNNASQLGSEAFVELAYFFARESTFKDTVDIVADFLIEVDGGELTLDTCTVTAADDRAIKSDSDVTLRNTDVTGSIRLTGDASVATCADLADPFNDLSCNEQYCSDKSTQSGNSTLALGVECYCDTTYGQRDPLTESCRDPPSIHVLQSTFDVFAAKPDALEVPVFFLNEGDEALNWRVEIVDKPNGHDWVAEPASGNLTVACSNGNFTLALSSYNLSAYEDHSLTVDIVSSSHPLPYHDNTTVTVSVAYLFQAAAEPDLSVVLPWDNASDTSPTPSPTAGARATVFSGEAGSYFRTWLQPVDVDGLWIKNSGADLVTAALHRNGSFYSEFDDGEDLVVCEVNFDKDEHLHLVSCLLEPFESGRFSLDVAVGAGTAGNSPVGVEVTCPTGMAAINSTCGCAVGNKLLLDEVGCKLCAAGSYGEGLATIDRPNPCTSCKTKFAGSTTLDEGTASKDECVCSPGLYMVDESEGRLDEENEPFVGCAVCPEGTECPNYGTTVETLTVLDEYWRLESGTTHVAECPTPKYCYTGVNGSHPIMGGHTRTDDEVNDATGPDECTDEETGEYCICHHTGPYCDVCTGEPGDKFKGLDGYCRSCAETRPASIVAVLIVFFLALFICTAVVVRQLAKYQSKILAMLTKTAPTGSSTKPPVEVEILDEEEDVAETAAAHKKARRSQISQQRATEIVALAAVTHASFETGKLGEASTSASTSNQGSNQGGNSSGGGDDGDSNENKLNCLKKLGRVVRNTVGDLQLVSVFNSMENVSPPSTWNSTTNFLRLFNLDLATLLPFSCVMTDYNYHTKVVFNTTWPLVSMLLLFVIIQALRVMKASPAWTRSLSKVGLLGAFLLYTGISNQIFLLFDCEKFEYLDGREMVLLRADYSIDCDSNGHKLAVAYGLILLFIIPIGVPLLYLLVLQQYRPYLSLERYRTIKQLHDKSDEELYQLRAEDPGLAHIKFLYNDYTKDHWFFEVVQCVRKMLMLIAVTIIEPGSNYQVAIAMFLAWCVIGLFGYNKPFRRSSDEFMMNVAQSGTFIVLLALMMLKNQDNIPRSVVFFMLWFGTLMPLVVALGLGATQAFSLGKVKYAEYQAKRKAKAQVAPETTVIQVESTRDSGGGGTSESKAD